MTTTEPPLRLAVVDDHPLIRQGFAAIANSWPKGRVVLMATDGLDYEHQCAELGHIHIALVDLCMPRRDGYETLRWITRHQPRTKTLAITLDPDPPYVKRALQAGARGVLSKTVDPPDLLRALEHVHIAGFHYNALVSHELRRTVGDEAALQHTPADQWTALTPREREFLLLYTKSNVPTLDDVARRMGIKPETAETYRKATAHKLNAHSKAEMVRCVLVNGWG